MTPLPRLLTVLLLALPVPWAGAEVPAAHAAGMLEASTEPGLSPLWGMVALKSGILRNIRFNGPYGSTPDPRFPRHPSLPEARNCPLDAVAAVVQHLFPSPDGENFVHNERAKDPVGEIARELNKGKKGAAGLRKVALLVQALAGYRKAVAALPAGDPALEPWPWSAG